MNSIMDLAALFVDFDAYFASAEQHMQPHLRGKPVGIAPVLAETSCCIAASYEAKASKSTKRAVKSIILFNRTVLQEVMQVNHGLLITVLRCWLGCLAPATRCPESCSLLLQIAP